MNRDRRAISQRREYRLRVPAGPEPSRAPGAALDPADIAPWVIAVAREWPRSVEDGLVAVRIGVQPRHVTLARGARPEA